ncbi:disulfide bond formation protein B [Azotobacter vinelandii]
MRHFRSSTHYSLYFSGSVDCAEVTWTLLSLSIPEWSLLIFHAYLVCNIVSFCISISCKL